MKSWVLRPFLARSLLVRSLIAVMASFLLIASQPSEAHQQKAAITRVLFNTHSGNLEVMHRFYLHDAEHAVKQLLDLNADILGSEQTREQVAQYVIERFALLGNEGNTLQLTYVGQELDDNFMWVYQEISLPENLIGLGVVNNILRDIWPEQSNLVNIERDGEIKTLNFDGDTEWLSVAFE